MTIFKERIYNPWPLDREEVVASLVRKRISRNRKARLMKIDKCRVIGSVDPGRMDVKLDVLFEQKQINK